jgi:Spy/CpxP family protein refolding chaperone
VLPNLRMSRLPIHQEQLIMQKISLYSIKMLPWLAASVCVAWQASASSFLPSQAIASAPQLVAQSATELAAGPAIATGQPDSADEWVIDDLTSDQSAQIELIFEEYQPHIEAAIVTYEEAAADLLDLLQPNTPTEDLLAAYETLLDTERAAEDLILERTLMVREVLTLDQRQVISDYLRNRLRL